MSLLPNISNTWYSHRWHMKSPWNSVWLGWFYCNYHLLNYINSCKGNSQSKLDFTAFSVQFRTCSSVIILSPCGCTYRENVGSLPHSCHKYYFYFPLFLSGGLNWLSWNSSFITFSLKVVNGRMVKEVRLWYRNLRFGESQSLRFTASGRES